MGRFAKRYTPLPFDVVVVLLPVASSNASTVAPGMPAPLVSRTEPVRSPLIACAWALPVAKAIHPASNMINLPLSNRFIKFPFPNSKAHVLYEGRAPVDSGGCRRNGIPRVYSTAQQIIEEGIGGCPRVLTATPSTGGIVR